MRLFKFYMFEPLAHVIHLLLSTLQFMATNKSPCALSLLAAILCIAESTSFDDDTASLASHLEHFYSRHPRSQSTNKCHHRNDHYAAYGKWANTLNATHGLAMLLPIVPRAHMRTVIEEDVAGLPILAGSSECPDQPTNDPYDHDSIMARALCPWYWRVNYDPLRIPAILPEAVCRCPRAVTGNPVVAYECQPLMMKLRILRFDDKCSKYNQQTLEISMACVSTIHSSKRLFKMAGIEEIFPELPVAEA